MSKSDRSSFTTFQKWVLLSFHQKPNQFIPAPQLIMSSCITSMTEDFNEKKALEDLYLLKKRGLLYTKNAEEHHPTYTSTIDGIIEAKKILKPILDSLDKKELFEIMSKLETTTSTEQLDALLRTATSQNNDKTIILNQIATYALTNMHTIVTLLDILTR